MGRKVEIADLIDAGEVAQLLGLSRATSISIYQRRYPDMPRPVVSRPSGRCLLWLRSEIEAWARRAGRDG
jgi:glutathione-regulated potassium-efflux system ancillary protein KefG